MDELRHHGILGQRKGYRRWQNLDGTYTEEGKRRYFGSNGELNRRGKRYEARRDKKDLNWVAKREEKIVGKVEKSVKRDVKALDRELYQKYKKQLKTGKIGYQYMFERNSRLADLMNQSSVKLRAPSGKCVNFVAKRRDMGVYVALGWEGADLSRYKNGVFESGKVGYRNEKANMQRYDKRR